MPQQKQYENILKHKVKNNTNSLTSHSLKAYGFYAQLYKMDAKQFIERSEEIDKKFTGIVKKHCYNPYVSFNGYDSLCDAINEITETTVVMLDEKDKEVERNMNKLAGEIRLRLGLFGVYSVADIEKIFKEEFGKLLLDEKWK